MHVPCVNNQQPTQHPRLRICLSFHMFPVSRSPLRWYLVSWIRFSFYYIECTPSSHVPQSDNRVGSDCLPLLQLAPLLARSSPSLSLPTSTASPCPQQASRPAAILLGSPNLSTSPRQRSLQNVRRTVLHEEANRESLPMIY
jgi:hypothetical protein